MGKRSIDAKSRLCPEPIRHALLICAIDTNTSIVGHPSIICARPERSTHIGGALLLEKPSRRAEVELVWHHHGENVVGGLALDLFRTEEVCGILEDKLWSGEYGD
jgi:hypothetical protein